MTPGPDQLLRVGVGLGFKRARLQYVYSILRGKDLETGEFDAERRDRQFETLKLAQIRTLNLQYWHDFFKAINQAGYRGGRLITSENNLLYTYTLYLLGRTEYGLEEHALRHLIARWFFMSSLTGRYTGSPESAMEFDLANLREVRSAEEFAQVLGRICDAALPSDFWSVSLPNELATSAPRSPSLFAYYASLVLLDARVLFSKQRVVDLLDPSVHSPRSAVERHHLFPKNHLRSLGITAIRDTNQIANYALVEWGDNAAIADKNPSEYWLSLKEHVSSNELGRMCYWHALPDGWENMGYSDFLVSRRELMAKVIADAYAGLSRPSAEEASELRTLPLAQLIGSGESISVEFKSTLRTNLHTHQPDPRIEFSCLRTIAGFMNSRGGTLVIGVADDGTSIGMEEDGFPSEDKMALHLVNLIRERIGPTYMMYLHPRFDDYQNSRVLVLECTPAKVPVFLRDGQVERFFVRTGPSTTELTASQTQQFIKQRFGNG
jgi:hypothetical protein